MKKLKLILAVVVLGLTVPAVASAQEFHAKGAAIHCEKQRYALKEVDGDSDTDRGSEAGASSSSARGTSKPRRP